jgi:hypothetical protein
MSGSWGRFRGFARQAKTAMADGNAIGIIGLIPGHSHVGMGVIVAAASYAVAVGAPKIFDAIYKRRATIIKEKGDAKKKVIDAKADARVREIQAKSETRNADKQTDADVIARRTILKPASVDDTKAPPRRTNRKTPAKKDDEKNPGSGLQGNGATNLRSIS